MVTKLISETTFSAEALRRLKEPRCRGKFRPIDAARQQLGLLSGADDRGQLRMYCLVDLDTQIVSDARFMAYGDLRSHPIADAYAELMRGKSCAEAFAIPASDIEALLKGDAATAFGSADEDAYTAIAAAQAELIAALPHVKLLPKPVEKEVYKRKREADWTEFDQRWYPLSLLKKIGVLQKCIKALLSKKLKRDDVDFSIEGLHDDFRVVVKITGVSSEEIPTLIRFMEEAVHEGIHPDLSVEEHQA